MFMKNAKTYVSSFTPYEPLFTHLRQFIHFFTYDTYHGEGNTGFNPHILTHVASNERFYEPFGRRRTEGPFLLVRSDRAQFEGAGQMRGSR